MQIEQNAAADSMIAAPASGRHWTLSRTLAAAYLLAGLVATVEAVAVPAQIEVDVHAASSRLRPGAPAHYVVEVRNSGGMQAGARVVVAIPEGLQNAAWTCVAHAGSRCSAATASGNLNQPLDGLAAGSALEFHLDARVGSAPPAYVDLQASTSLPTGARCADGQTAPCRSRVSLPAGAGVVLDLSSSATALVAGQVVQYSINAHTDTVHASTAGSVLRSPVPNGLINSRWTCQSSVGACAQTQGAGPIEQVLGNFSGSELRFEINAEVAANPPPTIVQIAALSPPYGAACVDGASRSLNAAGGVCVVRSTLATTPWIFASRSPDYSLDDTTVSNRFVFENRGSAIPAGTISMPMPEGAATLRWTCAGEGMRCPRSSGSGAIQQAVAAWPAAARLIYDVSVGFDPASAIRTQARMSVMPSTSARCGISESAPPCFADEAAVPSSGDLAIEMQVDRLGASPGQSVVYRVDVGNSSGTASVRNLVLDVPLPQGIDAFTSWSCVSSGAGGACPVATGSGPIRQVFSQLDGNARLTYRIVAQVGANASEKVQAVARLVPPAGADAGCRSRSGANAACVASAGFATVPVLALDQYARNAQAGEAGALNYSMDVFNLGAGSGRMGIQGFWPDGLTGTRWICSGLGMACPEQNGSGSILAQLVQMPSGAGLRFDVSANPSAPAESAVDSVLKAVPQARGNCLPGLEQAPSMRACINEAELRAGPLLELSVDAREAQLLSGGQGNFVVTLENRGSDAHASRLDIPLPEGIERIDWYCVGHAGATCPLASGSGAVSGNIALLPAGGSLVYSVRARIGQVTPPRVGLLASLVPPAGGRCAHDSCIQSITLPVSQFPAAHLDLTLTPAQDSVTPGASAAWTLDIRNLGSESAHKVAITSGAADDGVSVLRWTCRGQECPVSQGAGPLNQVVEILPAYDASADLARTENASGRLVYSLEGRIDGVPRSEVKVSANALPATPTSCTPTPCQVESAVIETPAGTPPSTITLTLLADKTEANLGDTINYTFQVSAGAGSGVVDMQVLAFAPAGVDSTTWTCVAAGGANCTSSGTGDVVDTVTFMPQGASLTYSIVAAVTSATQYPFVEYSGSVGSSMGPITCVPASCGVFLSIPLNLPPASVQVTKTANRSSLDPGGSVQYTVTIANTGVDGDTVAQNLQIGDPIPNGLESFAWTCTGVGFKAFCPEPSGTGPIADSINFLNPGESIVYTIDAVVSANASGEVTNRAFFVGDNVSCTPASCQAISRLPVAGAAGPVVEVSKLANPSSGIPVAPGQAINWTLRASNSGAATLAPVVLADILPTNVEGLSVQPGAGVQCSSLAPTPGEQLVCTIPQGFSGERLVVISATVPGSAISAISNSVSVSGEDQPTCVSCSVSNPIALPVDVSIANPRAFSAGGIQGTLVDIVNLSAVGAGNITVSVNPAASVRLLAPLSTGCTATQGAGGSVSVSCPNPPSSQGIQCTGSSCSLAQIPSGSAVSLFVALNTNSSATLEAPVTGDINPANNSINLTAGGTP